MLDVHPSAKELSSVGDGRFGRPVLKRGGG